MPDTTKNRENILLSYGAKGMEIDELLAYDKNVFDRTSLNFPVKLPLQDEPFITAWERYTLEAGENNVFECLKKRLVQLRFPIRGGISRTAQYREATLEGASTENMTQACGLMIKKPGKLSLMLHQTPAGRIPIITTREREDFVSLVRALVMKNEPAAIPDSMGACTVKGYNNWDRIYEYRKQWESQNAAESSEEKWQSEFQRIVPQRKLYRDRFIILSDGPYSAVSAQDIGLGEEEWKSASLAIRREHESAHYFTGRLFQSMRNNLLDELIADYAGIVSADGRYNAGWFFRFMGLESFPDYRDGGRLQNYRGKPPLSDNAFKILQAMVKDAAENLEQFDAGHSRQLHNPGGQALMLAALTCLTLEELASKVMKPLLQQAVDETRQKFTIL